MTPPCIACGEPLHESLVRAGMPLHINCEPLLIDPDILASDLFATIGDALINQPRSLQRRIGPSEIGIPCDRRIGYILSDTPKVRDETVAWKPAIGTAMHELFADMFIKANMRLVESGNPWRYHVEERVTVGAINGVDITGSCDLFDAWSGAVWDWKTTSKNQLREKYRPHGPGEQYRTQFQLYGLGWKNRGFTVRTVGGIFFTRDGEFTDRHVWSEPFDEQVALDALARANDIAAALGSYGGVLEDLPTGPAYCGFCSWYRKNASQISVACPGHPSDEPATAYPFDDLLPKPGRAA
jgi:hypothetical protein